MADEISVKVTGSTGDLQAAMAQASAAVRESVGSMTESLESLKAVAASVQTAMLAVTAVLAGGSAFKSAVNETVNLTKESNALGKQFGISATDASVLKVALDSVFVSQETMSTAGNKITQTLKTNEGAFKDLGVATRDQNGDFRSTLDIMTDTNARLLQFKEGTDRNVEGMKIYGRAWAAVAPTLKLTGAAMDEARETAQKLHLVVGVESLEAASKYRSAMNGVNEVMTGLKKAIGDALLPILTEMGNWFREIGPQAVDVMRGAMVGLTVVWEGFVAVVRTVYDNVVAIVQEIVVSLLTLAEVAQKAFKFDFSGAKAAFQTGWGQMKDIAVKAAGDVQKAWQDAVDKSSASMSRMLNPETASTQKDGGAASKDPEIDANADLAASIQQLSDVEMLHITKSKMGWTEIDRTLKEVDKSSGDYFKNQEKRWKTEDELSLYHRKQAAEDAAILAQMFQPMSRGFDTAVTGILKGTMTLRQGLQTMVKGILDSFINMTVQLVQKWIMGELQKTAVTQAHTAIRSLAQKAGLISDVAAQEGATATTVATKGTEATTVIAANAGEAASGAAASVASIPYVGWAMVAGVIAATLAAVKGISSASGGYDIPAGVNPLTQLHQREMVLPAKYADAIRGMADGQGSGSQGDVHLHVHTQSTQDFAKFLKANAHVLAPAIRQMRNNFVPVMV